MPFPTPLTIDDLFTPAPSGVGVQNPPADSWLAQLIQIAKDLGLSTTSWFSGSMIRTMMAITATGLAKGDTRVSLMAQGGFLLFASAVTTDPSVTPGAKPGPLDIVAWSEFNVLRTPAVYATGPLTITNSTASTFNYAAGAFHCSASGGKTYHNVDAISIAPGTATITVAADIAGTSGTTGANTITQLVTSINGVTITNPGQLIGAPAQSNAQLVLTCQAKQAARSPDGAVGAYVYFALQASAILADETLLNGDPIVVPLITRAQDYTNPGTGLVTTVIASENGAVPGVTNLAVTGATNATPVEITTATAHGLSTGDVVTVSGVRGNGGANVTSTIVVTGANTFTLDNSVGTAAYVSGGVVEGGALGQIDRVIQGNCVSQGVDATTVSATPNTAAVVVDVWLPASFAASAPATIQSSLTLFFSDAPIGGYTDPGGAYTNVILLDAVIARVFASAAQGGATYLQQAKVTIGGVAADYSLGTYDVFVPNPITVNTHVVS